MSKEQAQVPNRKVFQSSNLTRGEFIPSTGAILLEFANGSQYLYSACGPELWAELVAAVSPGTFFGQRIRNNPDYPVVKARGPRQDPST